MLSCLDAFVDGERAEKLTKTEETRNSHDESILCFVADGRSGVWKLCGSLVAGWAMPSLVDLRDAIWAKGFGAKVTQLVCANIRMMCASHLLRLRVGPLPPPIC